MSKLPQSTLQRLTSILLKPTAQRQLQQIHFITVILKKCASAISDLLDWQMLSQCIQLFQIWDTEADTIHEERRSSMLKFGIGDVTNGKVKKQNQHKVKRVCDVQFILVLKGYFCYHGMIYSEGEFLLVTKGDQNGFVFGKNSLYAVLMRQTKQAIKKQAEQRFLSEKKQFAKKLLFSQQYLSPKDQVAFFDQTNILTLQKNQILPTSNTNTIYLILQGSIYMNYNWKRVIRLRQLGIGSLFSTYLGNYFRMTNSDEIFPQLQEIQKQNKHLEIQNSKKNKYQFEIIGCSDICYILSFSPDIFYEEEKFCKFKYIVQNAWNLYLERVVELERVISEVGPMREQKDVVLKNIKEEVQLKFLKERCVSVPVAIERRKLRKIVYNIFSEKSTRRKAPNMQTQSASKLSNSTIQPKKGKFLETTQKTKNKDTNISLLTFTPPPLLPYTLSPSPPASPSPPSSPPFLNSKKQSKTMGLRIDLHPSSFERSVQRFRLNTASERRHHFSSSSNRRTGSSHTFRMNTVSSFQTDSQFMNQENQESFYRFFRPEQFISKKLRNHYESVLLKQQPIKVPMNQTLQSQSAIKMHESKNKRQYFDEYVNERRIVKLGPKKRLLYKQRKGF